AARFRVTQAWNLIEPIGFASHIGCSRLTISSAPWVLVSQLQELGSESISKEARFVRIEADEAGDPLVLLQVIAGPGTDTQTAGHCLRGEFQQDPRVKQGKETRSGAPDLP